MDQSSPHTKTRKNSKASFASRTSRVSRNVRRHKNTVEDDTDMEDDIKSLDDPTEVAERHTRRRNDDDFTPELMDQSDDNSEEHNNFEDKVKSRSKNRKERRGSKRPPIYKPTNKDSESQTTFMMNIQTTADLISYVKRRQNKRNVVKNKRKQRNSRPSYFVPSYVNPKVRRDLNHMRLIGLMQNNKSIEIQTDDIDILDLRASEINLTEVYHFDKVSSNLKKLVIERGTDAEILRQFEYIHKDTIRHRYKPRNSLIGRYGKNLSKQDLFKNNIAHVVSKTEINRLNDAYKAIMNMIKDYEHEQAYFQEKRECIGAKFPLFKENENDVFNRGWRKGYAAGYQRGNSNGFFKGSIESQYIGHQKGIEEGMQEGWNFGFDEGFKTGVRKVFRDARDAGIDLSSLDMMEYISQEDKIKGLMRNLYTKLTKVFAASDRLEAANKLHDKFSSFSDKRKRLAVKVGKKNIVKMITTFFNTKINTNSSNILLHEFLFDE